MGGFIGERKKPGSNRPREHSKLKVTTKDVAYRREQNDNLSKKSSYRKGV